MANVEVLAHRSASWYESAAFGLSKIQHGTRTIGWDELDRGVPWTQDDVSLRLRGIATAWVRSRELLVSVTSLLLIFWKHATYWSWLLLGRNDNCATPQLVANHVAWLEFMTGRSVWPADPEFLGRPGPSQSSRPAT